MIRAETRSSRKGKKAEERRSNASRWQVERGEKVGFFKKSFSSPASPVIRETTLDYRRYGDDTFGSRTQVNDG